VAVTGVVAPACLKLLQKADHSGPSKLFAKRFEAFDADFFIGLAHGPSPSTNPGGWRQTLSVGGDAAGHAGKAGHHLMTNKSLGIMSGIKSWPREH
jgi:hypothetical protein